tara:strand:+ start:93 stop:536 length:444 start_codon:yes stop_codon:yes gene_type:complete
MKIMTCWGEEDINETRICIHCGEEKHVSEIELDRPHTAPRGKGYRNECKACRRKINRDITKLKREYNSIRPHITDKCIICQRTGEEIQKTASQGAHKKSDPWVLDHDHLTNEYRGWICNHCNNGLSGFKDNVESMKRAIQYVEKCLI